MFKIQSDFSTFYIVALMPSSTCVACGKNSKKSIDVLVHSIRGKNTMYIYCTFLSFLFLNSMPILECIWKDISRYVVKKIVL